MLPNRVRRHPLPETGVDSCKVKRKMKMIAITCLVFYAGLCLLVGVFQRRMLYFPPAYSARQVD